jgi:hypothetical protein
MMEPRDLSPLDARGFALRHARSTKSAMISNGSTRIALAAGRFLVVLAMANAPFWLLSQWLFIHRALINLDTALAVLLMSWSPTLGLAALLAAWSLDIGMSWALMFRFTSPHEFIHSLSFAPTLQVSRFLTWENVLPVVPFAACAVAIFALTRRQTQMCIPGAVICLGLLLADASNGSSLLSRDNRWRLPVNVAGSPAATLLVLEMNQPKHTAPQALPTEDTVQSLADLPGWAAQHPEQGILFIVVESMGLPVNDQLRTWLATRLVNAPLTEHYRVVESAPPFRGSTTSGELRALCALTGSYRQIDPDLASSCLPARLAAQGWMTIGIHGFSGKMFDRETWWPVIGIQSRNFVDSDFLRGSKRCGTVFAGACDEQVIERAVELLNGGRRFVYVLTLNTHLPIEAHPVPAELQHECELTQTDPESCDLLAALGRLLETVKDAVSKAVPAPLVIVVGDHAPPFSRDTARASFDQERVPAFALIPND